jgi:hypothetical protein
MIKFFKKPNEYPDWYIYNDPQGRKQPGRKSGDILICDTPNCSSGGEVSEHEAFYTFAKQSFLSRLFSGGNLYICPFCKGNNLRSNLASEDPELVKLIKRIK